MSGKQYHQLGNWKSYSQSLSTLFTVLIVYGSYFSVAAEDCENYTDVSNCNFNGTLSAPQGWIINSQYPVPVQVNRCELFHILVNSGQKVTISFEDFDISANSEGCVRNYIEIGPSPCVVLCGSNYPLTYTSNSSEVWIRYMYSETVGPLRRGFKLKYIAGNVPSSEPCTGHDVFECKNGKCILNSWVCNGVTECEDFSDESSCPTTSPPREPPGGYVCGHGYFGCIDKASTVYRCYREQYKCNGIQECLDGSDEYNCDATNRPCQQQWLTEFTGWIASPKFRTCTTANCHDCQTAICVPGNSPVQLRFQPFYLRHGSVVEVRDGQTSSDRVLRTLRDGVSLDPSATTIESSENCVFVRYHAGSSTTDTVAFNITYQAKGICLANQFHCPFDENDCYEAFQHCNGVWDCPLLGGDEFGCGCKDKYTCGPSALLNGRCFFAHQRCDGVNDCANMADEKHCSSRKCGQQNGTFLCLNHQCIRESYICDGNNDCEDFTDELQCPLSSKVILSAVIGSLCCGLLLAIAVGITRRFYVLRMAALNGQSTRFTSPVTAIEERIFAQRSAPPLYQEAMATSRPYEEYRREVLERQRIEQQQRQLNATATVAGVSAASGTARSAAGSSRETGVINSDREPLVSNCNDDSEDDEMIDASVDESGDSSTAVGPSVESPVQGCLAHWQRSVPKAISSSSSSNRAEPAGCGTRLEMMPVDNVTP